METTQKLGEQPGNGSKIADHMVVLVVQQRIGDQPDGDRIFSVERKLKWGETVAIDPGQGLSWRRLHLKHPNAN